ncbi:MAG: flagellar export chaperone FliS [Gammaproteobacteria bacterium]|nr:flagellar export chaperone FliS [Gammaproteobacteria bacterium]MDH5470754.1 flagellar export chaperone FliS [Gammaproteobacteria bacterium]
MNKSTQQGAAGQYASVGTQTGVSEASPHRLIQMLLDGALDKIARARGAMQRKEYEEKGNHITSTSSIILGLRSSLDLEAGGELAANLDSLYEYIFRRLMEAHAQNDEAALDEVSSLLREIKSGWDALPQETTAGGDAVNMVGA